jgi:adenylate cyclase class 2
MKPEIEARFLHASFEALREKLRAAGAEPQYPMRSMRRVLMDYPDHRLNRGEHAWSLVRIRDEGVRTLLTYKQISRAADRETHEIEVEVSSYEQTIALLEHIGLVATTEQHTHREVWHLEQCEVSLDEWPWLPPMVEIEGPDEQSVRSMSSLLGFDWQDKIPGNALDAYLKVYPDITDDDIKNMPLLTFDVEPVWHKQRQHA